MATSTFVFDVDALGQRACSSHGFWTGLTSTSGLCVECGMEVEGPTPLRDVVPGSDADRAEAETLRPIMERKLRTEGLLEGTLLNPRQTLQSVLFYGRDMFGETVIRLAQAWRLGDLAAMEEFMAAPP